MVDGEEREKIAYERNGRKKNSYVYVKEESEERRRKQMEKDMRVGKQGGKVGKREGRRDTRGAECEVWRC